MVLFCEVQHYLIWISAYQHLPFEKICRILLIIHNLLSFLLV